MNNITTKQELNIQTFKKFITELFEQETPFLVVLSKPRLKTNSIKQLKIKTIYSGKQPGLLLSYQYTNNQTQEKKHDFEKAVDVVIKHIVEDFYFGEIKSADHIWLLLQNKQGTSTLQIKRVKNELPYTMEHNRIKTELISYQAPYLKDLEVTSSSGNLLGKNQHKFRQINRYIELISHLIEGESAGKVFKIADMGSGKAYLSFALYEYLISRGFSPEITGYEIRQDLVDKCNLIAKKNNMEHLRFVCSSIDEANIGKCDMIIALHACDIATDMAISKGIESKATYIVLAPCCHKQIRKSINPPKNLQPILNHGILLERQAEILTDAMRALFLEHAGYRTKVFEFISPEHTGKNLMITAVKGKKNPQALDELKQLKKQFGISFHILEKFLEIDL